MRPIAEDNRRYGEIAVVDLSDECGAIGMIFDVDLVKVDSGTREQRRAVCSSRTSRW